MRILVADDESLVRYGLVSVLQEILPSSSVILEAANGLELVETIRDFRPHIAFVDIRMPKMDGLEAISRAVEFAPKTLWVVLTGHADFSYARKSLKLGVEDFLLKPPDPEELKALLKKLMVRARNLQVRGNRELEARISSVLGDTTSIRLDPYFQKPRFWQAGLILWNSLLPNPEETRKRREFAVRLIGLLDKGDEFSGTVVSMKDGSLLLVLSIPAGGMAMNQVIELWHKRFVSLKAETGDIRGVEIADTWLLTRVVTDVEEMFSEVDKLNQVACLRYLHHPGELIKYSNIVGNNKLFRYLTIAELLEDLGSTWKTGQEDDYHGLIHKLEDEIRNLQDDDINASGPGWYARYVIPLPGLPPDSLTDLIRRLHNEGHELFENQPNRGERDSPQGSLVDKTVAVMNRRYRETVGIAQVAEELGVSPNYLSTVFKKETGMSFTRHLTELRLDKARELLHRPNANIGHIARSLGYQSGRHFTRLFKDRFGMTPSQWINKRRN